MYREMGTPGLLASTVIATGCALPLCAMPLTIIAVSTPLTIPLLFIGHLPRRFLT
jgi:hypothetical protein